MTSEMKKVVFAAAVGSVFEYYDFWVYAMLAPILGPLFFPGDSIVQIVLALAAMATTAASRPIGGLIFGYVGDRYGRKSSFVVTLLIMSISTFGIGLLPTYATIGISASVWLVLLRVLQGVALGGEFSGALIYVAEYAGFERRGLFSAIVLAASTVGIAVISLVLFTLHSTLDDKSFLLWGWRVPFLLSFFLFVVSVGARLKIKESPVFEEMVRKSELSPSPIKESLAVKKNLKVIFWTFLCIMLGESGINQSDYIIFLFLANVLKVDMFIVDKMLMCVYLLHIPVLIYFGHLSDKFGRKTILLVAFLLTSLFYTPGFHYLVNASYPAYGRAIAENPVVIHHRQNVSCEFGIWEHFLLSTNRLGNEELTTCQKTVHWLGDNVVNFSRDGIADREYVSVGKQLIEMEDRASFIKALRRVGYIPDERSSGMSFWKMVLCSFIIMIPVSMVFGTCSSALLDIFPPRIRYTSSSFIYGMGHGFLGGFVPVIIMYSIFHFGSIYSATYYTTHAAFLSLLFGLFFYPKQCYR